MTRVDVFFKRRYSLEFAKPIGLSQTRSLVKAAFYYDMVRAGYRPVGEVSLEPVAGAWWASCQVRPSDVFEGLVAGRVPSGV